MEGSNFPKEAVMSHPTFLDRTALSHTLGDYAARLAVTLYDTVNSTNTAAKA